ncbi:MAG: hypothetical protein P4L33_12355 [Capsulimonadaceae bacterium]|nr:hypothetical protein [Capsulimonadaceae bacterium]
MTTAHRSYFDIVTAIRPDELRAKADAGLMPKDPPRFNAHVHLPPNFTAFDTTKQAVDLAAAQHVGVLGASNYYDYSIYKEFGELAASKGIFPLFGLEIIALIDDLVAAGVKINDPGNPGKMYLCGKGITKFDPLTPEAGKLLGQIRGNDSARMAAITEKLAQVILYRGIDTGLTVDKVIDRVVARHGCPRSTVTLQERHIAQAFQEVIFDIVDESDRWTALERVFGTGPKDPNNAVVVQNEIRSHLLKAGKPAFIPDTFVGFEHAYRSILALGGIPSYPILGDGASPVCPYEEPVERLIDDLKARGIHAVEFIPIRNSPEMLSSYAKALREAGLIVTAGTEHNTRDLLPIEPACAGGEPIPADVKEILREGVYVVAAHQYRVMQGLPGFVDETGGPNREYATDEQRIAAFRREGAALVAIYQSKTSVC